MHKIELYDLLSKNINSIIEKKTSLIKRLRKYSNILNKYDSIVYNAKFYNDSDLDIYDMYVDLSYCRDSICFRLEDIIAISKNIDEYMGCKCSDIIDSVRKYVENLDDLINKIKLEVEKMPRKKEHYLIKMLNKDDKKIFAKHIDGYLSVNEKNILTALRE